MKNLSFSSFAFLGLSSALLPGAAFAGPASINSTQLGVTVAPIQFSATRLGGYVDSSGNGLTAGAAPTVSTTGSLDAGTGMTAAANTTFNLSMTARAGDAAVATATAGAVPNTAFGIQSGKYSVQTGAALTISDANVAALTAGSTQGVTATAIIATEMKSAENANKISRIATSSNDQATFKAERQAAKFQLGGSGLTAVTADAGVGANAVFGGMNSDTNLGVAPTITAATGGTTQAGVAFTKSQEVRTGQAGADRVASSTNVTQPGYGVFTNTLGGTTAGAIGAGAGAIDMNDLTVAAGGAGTTSTLTVIQSLSAF